MASTVGAAGVGGMVTSAMLAGILADGRSLLVIRDYVKPNADKANVGSPYGVNSQYAMGLHRDSLGRQWMDVGHLLELEGCDSHIMLGYTAETAVVVAMGLSIAAVAMLLVSRRPCALAAVLFASAAAFLTPAAMLLMSFYAQQHRCSQDRLIQLQDFFELSWALPVVLACAAMSLVNTAALLFVRCSAQSEESQDKQVSTEDDDSEDVVLIPASPYKQVSPSDNMEEVYPAGMSDKQVGASEEDFAAAL